MRWPKKMHGTARGEHAYTDGEPWRCSAAECVQRLLAKACWAGGLAGWLDWLAALCNSALSMFLFVLRTQLKMMRKKNRWCPHCLLPNIHPHPHSAADRIVRTNAEHWSSSPAAAAFVEQDKDNLSVYLSTKPIFNGQTHRCWYSGTSLVYL